MIYEREYLTVLPATPAGHDALIALMQEQLLPLYGVLGARLVAAFLSHAENWGQVIHLIEHDDLASFAAFRQRAAANADYQKAREAPAELAPVQRTELLEPVGPIPVEDLHAAIAASASQAVGKYSFAELELAPGKAAEFKAVLGAVRGQLPIVAALRGVAGNPRMVYDLWKGALAQDGYQAATPQRMAFFEPLRKLAPLEKLVHLYPLPYSPLK
jgi:hypothetical protein